MVAVFGIIPGVLLHTLGDQQAASDGPSERSGRKPPETSPKRAVYMSLGNESRLSPMNFILPLFLVESNER